MKSYVSYRMAPLSVTLVVTCCLQPFCLRDPTCSRFGITPACDRQADRQTDSRTRDDSKYCASIASRGQTSHLTLRSPSFLKR